MLILLGILVVLVLGTVFTLRLCKMAGNSDRAARRQFRQWEDEGRVLRLRGHHLGPFDAT